MEHGIIEMEHFSFSLGGRRILIDVSFRAREGEYVSVVGPNGAGKTTLLKCLCRIHRGGSGAVRIAGRPLQEYGQKDLALQVSYVPQADGRLYPFTVHEFVMMGRYPHLGPFSSPGARDEQAVRDALALTGTAEFAERYPGTLSGGERQKVFIAAALAQEARILLLDEPATFLDPRHEAEIHGLLARANRERGVTILSVMHDINSAAVTSRRILALKNGAVAFHGEPEAFMNGEILAGIYEKSFLFATHPRSGKRIVVPELFS